VETLEYITFHNAKNSNNKIHKISKNPKNFKLRMKSKRRSFLCKGAPALYQAPSSKSSASRNDPPQIGVRFWRVSRIIAKQGSRRRAFSMVKNKSAGS
jgi:hypothetical protein